MKRSSSASLSSTELGSLLGLSVDPGMVVSANHLHLLTAMQLVTSETGVLTLTDEGRERVRRVSQNEPAEPAQLQTNPDLDD